MALTFPLPEASFWDLLRIIDIPFYVPSAMEMSEDGAGVLTRADLGARLWQGSVSVAPHYHSVVARAEALVAGLSQAGGSFLAYDKRVEFPAADPTGTILGAAAPVIGALTGDASEITLSGLPAGYVISPGDNLSFTYGTPVRYALHKVVLGAVATGGGVAGVMVPFVGLNVTTAWPMSPRGVV